MLTPEPSTRAKSDVGLLLSSACNLFISAAGAGLLSYPFAVLQQGIALNIGLTIIFAILNGFTDLVLAAFAAKYQFVLRAGTFDEVILRGLGRRAYLFAVASVVIGCVGAMVGFTMIAADMAAPVVADLCANSRGTATDDAVCSMVSSRWFIVLAFAIIVELPLSSCDRMHSLGFSSFLAAVSVLAVGFLMLTRGIESLADGADTGLEPVSWLRSDLNVVLGIPISIFSLGNHIQVVPLIQELPAHLRTCRKFSWVVYASVSLCVVLYLTTGVFGYVTFRDATKGDILMNFSLGDGFADAAKGLMALHIILAFPVLVVPCRKACFLLWHYWRASRNVGSAAFRPGAGAGLVEMGLGLGAALPSSRSRRGNKASLLGEDGSSDNGHDADELSPLPQVSPRTDSNGFYNSSPHAEALPEASASVSASQYAGATVARRRSANPEKDSSAASREHVSSSSGGDVSATAPSANAHAVHYVGLPGPTTTHAGSGSPSAHSHASDSDRDRGRDRDGDGDTQPLLHAPSAAAGDATAGDDATSFDARLWAEAEAQEAGTSRVCGIACTRTHALMNVSFVLGSAALAILFPQVQIVFGLLGATVSVSQIYTFPGFLLVAHAREAAAAAKSGSKSYLPLVGPCIPRSLWAINAAGWTLIAISVAVNIVGTGVYVYDTWIKT